MARQRLFFSLLTSVNAHTRPFEITTSRAPVCVCVCLRARACVEFQSLLHLTDFHEIQYQRNVTVDHQNVTGFNSLQQFLTNHGCFRSYLHKRNKAPTPLCSCPEKAEQTAQHLLTECSLFTKDRLAVFRKLPLPLIMQHHINTAEVSILIKNIYHMLQEQSKSDQTL